MTGPTRIADVLPAVLQDAGIREHVQRSEVLEQWKDRVGPAIARVARARMVSGSVLVVEVRSSAWLNELDLMKNEILRKLNEDRGEVRIEGLRFVIAESP